MKFGSQLTQSAIPEWKDKYLDYKAGKKKLKKLRGELVKDKQTFAGTDSGLTQLPFGPTLHVSHQAKIRGDLYANLANSIKMSVRLKPEGYGVLSPIVENVGLAEDSGSTSDVEDNVPPQPGGRNYSDTQKEALRVFVNEWLISHELAKCESFYLWLLDECEKKYNALSYQIELYRLQKEQSLRPKNIYSSVEDYDSPSERCSEYNPRDVASSVALSIKDFLKQNNLLPSWPKLPFTRIDDDTEAARYAFLMNFMKSRHRKSSIAGDSDEANTGSTYDVDTEPLLGSTDLKRATFGYDLFATLPSELTVQRAQKLLSNAVTEFYLYLQLVKNYRDINVVGFRKMVKKFDKTFHTSELQKFMDFAAGNYSLFKHVDNDIKLLVKKMQATNTIQNNIGDLQPTNPSDDPLLWWEFLVKSWYVKDLTDSPKEMRKNNKRLRKLLVNYDLNDEMIHRNNRAILQMTFSSLLLGASFSLILYTLYVSFAASHRSYIHKVLFPLWGGWYMTLLMALLFQLDCFIWFKCGINYRFIMFGEIKTRDGTKLFNNDFATTAISLQLYYLSYFVFISSIWATASFFAHELSPWSFLSIVSNIILFTLPSKLLPYWDKLSQTRDWLVVSLIRLMLSGLYPVEFTDFFLGDIVCSLTYSISDIAMFTCIYATDGKGMCSSSHLKSMGVMSCLPNVWRLLQCIRRFLDSGNWFPHLINGIKYILGVTYNASLCAYRMSSGNQRIRFIFILFATLNSAMTSIWDLVLDWSLFQTSHSNIFLRDDLYLAGKPKIKDGKYKRSRKAVYYFAMIWDVLIRFQWIVYAVAPASIQQNAKTSFILALTEVLRRFNWIIFRVENEHVANVHLFRVVGDAPLPYPILDDRTTPSSQVPEPSPEMEELEVQNEEMRLPFIRRKATAFRNISQSIPWAHTSDFQRPTVVSMDGSYPDEDESFTDTTGKSLESDSESVADV